MSLLVLETSDESCDPQNPSSLNKMLKKKKIIKIKLPCLRIANNNASWCRCIINTVGLTFLYFFQGYLEYLWCMHNFKLQHSNMYFNNVYCGNTGRFEGFFQLKLVNTFVSMTGWTIITGHFEKVYRPSQIDFHSCDS